MPSLAPCGALCHCASISLINPTVSSNRRDLKIICAINYSLNVFAHGQIQPARLAIRLFHPRPEFRKAQKMLERRKNSRSLIDPAKARKDFWAMKLAEHDRLEKLYGRAESLSARQS